MTAVDGDREVNNPISYSLVSNGIDKESDLFRIERHTGIVFTTSSLDRESSASGSYILQITVRMITLPLMVTSMGKNNFFQIIL